MQLGACQWHFIQKHLGRYLAGRPRLRQRRDGELVLISTARTINVQSAHSGCEVVATGANEDIEVGEAGGRLKKVRGNVGTGNECIKRGEQAGGRVYCITAGG